MELHQRRRSLTSQVEKIQTAERRRNQLKIYAGEHEKRQRMFESLSKSDERIEDLRLTKLMMRDEREREMEESILKAKENRKQRIAIQDQEENLARKVKQLKLDEFCEEKMRQHLRENSMELRELEAKIRAGYQGRELAAQVAEKVAKKVEEQKRKQETAKIMQEEFEKAAVAAHQQVVEKHAHARQYQRELLVQLEEQKQKKQKDYEDYQKEKLMINEIVRKIYQEEQKEKEIRVEKQQATKRFVEEFMEKREEWKRMQRACLEQENQRILKYASMQKNRKDERLAELREREKARSEMLEQISEKIRREQKEKKEKEMVRLELIIEERKEADRQKQVEEEEMKKRNRMELQAVQKQQLRMKELRLKELAREEEEFRQQMMAKFAEDDKVEQMNVKKRRMKQLEHQRAVEVLIKSRRQAFEAAKEQEVAERRKQEVLQALSRKMFEEERQKLLKQHGSQLVGYFPKGVFKNEDELKRFDSTFQGICKNPQ